MINCCLSKFSKDKKLATTRSQDKQMDSKSIDAANFEILELDY